MAPEGQPSGLRLGRHHHRLRLPLEEQRQAPTEQNILLYHSIERRMNANLNARGVVQSGSRFQQQRL